MMLPLGEVVPLESGLIVTVVGEVDIVDNNRRMKKLVGRLQTPRMINGHLVPYILFSISEVVRYE